MKRWAAIGAFLAVVGLIVYGIEPAKQPAPAPSGPPAQTADPGLTFIPLIRGPLKLPGRKDYLETAVLPGRRYMIDLKSRAILRELTPAQRSTFLPGSDVPAGEGTLRAAPGHEFLVVASGAGENLIPEESTSGAATRPSFELVVGNSVRPLPRFSDHELVLVASVPIGSEAILRARDEGRTHAISLRSGAVTGVTGSYRGCGRALTGVRSPSYGIVTENLYPGAPKLTSLTVEVRIVTRPYVDAFGWAAPGRCWLSVSVSGIPLPGYSGLKGILNGGPKIYTAAMEGRSLPPRAEGIYDVPENPGTVRIAVGPVGPRSKSGRRLAWIGKGFSVPAVVDVPLERR